MFEQNLKLPNTLNVLSTAANGAIAHDKFAWQILLRKVFDQFLPDQILPLGQGSNVVLHPEIYQFALLIRTQGIQILQEDVEHVRIKVEAGEDWHSLVQYTLGMGWYGLENLALIPGTVGAAPVQNIGAYGVEIGQFIESVEAYDGKAHLRTLSNPECQFGYRDSLFKAINH